MAFFNPTTWAGKPEHSLLPKCGQCGLSSKCHSPKMPATGRGKYRILFVGEAPGEQEDRQGEQLIGDAGQTLRRILKRVGIDLDNCWKTNAVICRPPKNEIDDLYIESCRPNLLRTIEELKPKVLVLLGISAVKAVIGTEWGGEIGPLGKWVGWTIPSPKFGWVCPTYHPSYINRTNENPVLVKMVEQHLQEAVNLEPSDPCSTSLARLSSTVEVIPDCKHAKRRIRDLAEQEGTLAFDYETTGLKPERPEQVIWTVSFCLNGEDTFACRIDETCHKALSRVLQNERLLKVGSNIKFEDRWTRAKLGHGVAGWHWDTMLAAHLIDNRPGITSVKFQAYIYLGIGDYSTSISPYLIANTSNGLNRIHEAPLQDLLLYNGLDSLLEYKVMERQKADLV